MKKLLPLLIGVFVYHITFAENNPTVKEQMTGLNRYWLFNEVDASVLKKRIALEGDIALIQMHLTLVEKHLREKKTNHLTAAQKEKRNWCLDILHAYRLNGVFPKNMHHATRTPYFIDDAGTACAVGHLIISTGYEAVAQTIHTENNYAYISELNNLYPQLKQWADEYGFELDELAWIQPGYGPSCDTTCDRSLSVLASGGTEPYSYYWNTNPAQYTDTPSNLCPGETYTLSITDANGDTMTDFSAISMSTMVTIVGNKITIEAAYEVITQKSSTADYGNCEGTATFNATGGSQGFNYTWLTTPMQYLPTATGLCQGTYRVLFQNMTCSRIDSVTVQFATGIDEKQENGLTVFPNPASEIISITLPAGAGGFKEYRLMDLTGSLVLASKNRNAIDVSGLSKGIYYIFAETETGTYRQPFLKE